MIYFEAPKDYTSSLQLKKSKKKERERKEEIEAPLPQSFTTPYPYARFIASPSPMIRGEL